MQTTTSSVPDVESRGSACAAPRSLAEIVRDKWSERGVVLDASGAAPALTRLLVDQLIAASTALAAAHIFTKNPDIPFCQVCQMSGINDRPIPHLKSCRVGQVLAAIEELRSPAERAAMSFDHGGETVFPGCTGRHVRGGGNAPCAHCDPTPAALA